MRIGALILALVAGIIGVGLALVVILGGSFVAILGGVVAGSALLDRGGLLFVLSLVGMLGGGIALRNPVPGTIMLGLVGLIGFTVGSWLWFLPGLLFLVAAGLAYGSRNIQPVFQVNETNFGPVRFYRAGRADFGQPNPPNEYIIEQEGGFGPPPVGPSQWPTPPDPSRPD